MLELVGLVLGLVLVLVGLVGTVVSVTSTLSTQVSANWKTQSEWCG